jgi:hypothetical protein
MLLGVAALASMLLIACGGSNDAATTPTPGGSAAATSTANATSSGGGGGVDPCALLSAADLDAATGLTWGEGTFNESLSSDQQFVCDWVTTSGGFATAQVLVHPTDAYFESNRSSAEGVFGTTDAPSINGASDTYATADGSIVGMKIGGRFVQVAYIPSNPGNVLDTTVGLAQAVADRL